MIIRRNLPHLPPPTTTTTHLDLFHDAHDDRFCLLSCAADREMILLQLPRGCGGSVADAGCRRSGWWMKWMEWMNGLLCCLLLLLALFACCFVALLLVACCVACNKWREKSAINGDFGRKWREDRRHNPIHHHPSVLPPKLELKNYFPAKTSTYRNS